MSSALSRAIHPRDEDIEIAVRRDIEEIGLNPDQKTLKRALDAIQDSPELGILFNGYLITAKGLGKNVPSVRDVTRLADGKVEIQLDFEFLKMRDQDIREFVSIVDQLSRSGFRSFGILPVGVSVE